MISRLGLSSLSMRRYGSFAGKTLQELPVATDIEAWMKIAAGDAETWSKIAGIDNTWSKVTGVNSSWTRVTDGQR